MCRSSFIKSFTISTFPTLAAHISAEEPSFFMHFTSFFFRALATLMFPFLAALIRAVHPSTLTFPASFGASFKARSV
eukprot:XP_001706312.1 Hypothetical protein GL50803_32181 [Giardia lamblia ATCC 50803]